MIRSVGRARDTAWRRCARVVASGALAAALALAKHAAAVSLPAASFVESLAPNVPGEGVPDPDPSAPDSLSTSVPVMNGNGSAQLTGSAVSVGGTQPSIDASATADGGASFEMDATVDDVYYFAVSGPASDTPIPIRIVYAGTTAASGPVADGLGRIQVDRVSPAESVLLDTLFASSVFPPSSDAFGDTVPADAPVDAVYSVRLQATARAQANGGISQSDVSIDPRVEIDPAFANAGLYQIAYSANIGTPEPSGSWSSLVGVASVALRRALPGRALRRT